MYALTKGYAGLVCCCGECGILFSFAAKDVYENKWVYCPVCRAKNDAMIDLSYNGVVKDYGKVSEEK